MCEVNEYMPKWNYFLDLESQLSIVVFVYYTKCRCQSKMDPNQPNFFMNLLTREDSRQQQSSSNAPN